MSEVDWDAVYGCNGTSGHVPGLLRALAGPSPDPQAYTDLFDHLYHQGSRWQASAVVVPFLVALVAAPATPDRSALVRMLAAVAIGDHRDDRLPFDAAFPEADKITDEQLRLLNLGLNGDGDEPRRGVLLGPVGTGPMGARRVPGPRGPRLDRRRLGG